MRIGCCANMLARDADGTGVENVGLLREAGFDYVELPLAQLAALADADYASFEARVLRSGLPCEACNNFFPTGLRLTGPDADLESALAYAIPAMRRAARVGAGLIVFGSGPAKMVPAGFPMAAAHAQLVELLRALSRPARELKLAIAIEPLRRQECNIINTAAAGLALARAVATDEVRLLVDFYHLDAEGEDCRIIEDAGAAIAHLHVADPQGRVFPRPSNEKVFDDFFAALRAISYRGRLSVEAYSGDPATDAGPALALLRAALPA